jgi:DNA gyrase subunit B
LISIGGLKRVGHEEWGKTGDSVVDTITPELDPGHGLIVRFYPDPEIFETVQFSYQVILERIKELAYLNPQVAISIKDDRINASEVMHFEGGLSQFVEYLGEGHQSILKSPIYNMEEAEDTVVEFAFLYNNSTSEIMQSYVNNISTVEGGTHVTGFRAGLSRAVQDYAKNHDLVKGVESIVSDDVREGLVAVLHVKVIAPQFEGQTKSKLGNSAVRGIVQSSTEKYLKSFFESYPNVAQSIVKRVIMAAAAREASRNAKELVRRKSALESGNLPGKLADCSSSDPTKAELYIVERESAGGSAKQARTRDYQAILPLRGKILNVEKAADIKTLANEEIRNLITVMGTNIKDSLDLSKLRYGKIIIMTDADVDGAHIRTLLLTFFYRFAKEIIQNGNLYIAQPPLFRVQKGAKIEYVYSEKEVDEVIRKMGSNAVVQRFKGLGEMNPSQLWETTMNPETRKLLQVTIEDAAYAERLLSILMGEKVEPRKKFIEENAKTVENIDA